MMKNTIRKNATPPSTPPETKLGDWKNMKLNGPMSAQELSKRDESHLSRLGKKRALLNYNLTWKLIISEVLKRRFGMVSMLGMSTTLMLTWEGILVLVYHLR